MKRFHINPRLVLFVVVFVIVASVFWLARGVLWPFALGLVLAYLIVPVVNRTQDLLPNRIGDASFGRPVSILIVYFAFLASVGIALALVVPPLLRQAVDLLASAPGLYSAAEQRVLLWIAANEGLFPAPLETLVTDTLDGDFLSRLAGPTIDIVKASGSATWGAVTSTISLLLGLVMVPIWLVYILRDTGHVRESVLDLIPHDIRPDVEALRVVGDKVLSGYVRGQLVIAITLGVLFTISLTVLGVPYSLLLGVVAGVLALIPFIGAILGAIPAVAVAMLVSFKLALMVMVAFVIIQLIDNMLITPRIQGRAVALNPAVIMVVVVIGQQLLGALGMLAAAPITAFLRDLIHYLYLRVGEDRPSAEDALGRVGYGEYVTDLVRGDVGSDSTAATD